MDWKARIYLWEICRGLATTMKHLVHNLLHRREMPTISYPEEKRPISIRLRAQHRLLPRPDGKPRCVACFLCATACPAQCITIEAGEATDRSIEKVPTRFDIDLLRCVFCGLCVEACPCDAIRMDTGIYDICKQDRASFVLDRERLLKTAAMPNTIDGPLPKTLPGIKTMGGGFDRHGRQ